MCGHVETLEPCWLRSASHLEPAGRSSKHIRNRPLNLGSLAISRALPVKDRRLVGPWCFLDRFGPLTFNEGKPMDVAPHPHIGLQTVTWLHDGEVAHSDSLGYESVLRPGGVNVMTSGNGIAHAEQTPRDNTGRLNGVQLWTALPDEHRHMRAGFARVFRKCPWSNHPSGVVQVFAGTLRRSYSPAPYYSGSVRSRWAGPSAPHAGRSDQFCVRACCSCDEWRLCAG